MTRIYVGKNKRNIKYELLYSPSLKYFISHNIKLEGDVIISLRKL